MKHPGIDIYNNLLIPGQWYRVRSPYLIRRGTFVPFYTGRMEEHEDETIWAQHHDIHYGNLVFYVGVVKLGKDEVPALHVGHLDAFGYILPDIVHLEPIDLEKEAD